jgi:hypothetical protein
MTEDDIAEGRELRPSPYLAQFPSHHRENSNMPSTITLYQIGVWFCVGFFTGAGWAIAAWLVGRILRF